MSDFSIRPVYPADHAAISELLRQSYAVQLGQFYSEGLLRKALPILTLTVPQILFGGRYYVVEDQERALAVAGWSDISPFGRTCPAGHAHLRHLACAPDRLRQGLGRALVRRVVSAAGQSGVTRLHSLCPLNAVAFCQATGFETMGEVVMGLTPELSFPAVHMQREVAGYEKGRSF
jgi:N-acetylglutamate synthase-like GNAT family acetyltransferase